MKNWSTDNRFAKAARVIRVVLARDNDDGLILQLKLTYDSDHSEMEWRFVGVTQLQFHGESTDLLALVLLQCEDVSSHGWEGIRFRVKDYEEEFVSFLCADIQEVVGSL
jgi:hypothetical protein